MAGRSVVCGMTGMLINQEILLLWAQVPVFGLTLYFLVWAAGRGSTRSPHVFACAARNVRRPAYAMWGLAMLAILPVNAVLTGLDAQLAQQLGLHDMGRTLAQIEAPVLTLFQAWTPAPLTALAVCIYVSAFPAMILAAVVIALSRSDTRLLMILALGYLANYVLTQPFYFLFPVSEVHSILPGVRHLMSEASPELAARYRPMSGLDNCFPSLHTSLTITLLLGLRTLGSIRVNREFGVLGGAIIATTLYLGIHWMADLVAGCAFALLCHCVALSLVNGPALAPAVKRA